MDRTGCTERWITCQLRNDRLYNLSPHSVIRKAVAPDRTPALFIADSPGLDFLNSIATPVDRPVDWLDSGEGLAVWLAEANLVPQEALNAATERAALGELDKVAGEARALREWFRGFVRKHMGRPLPPGAIRELTPLNSAFGAR